LDCVEWFFVINYILEEKGRKESEDIERIDQKDLRGENLVLCLDQLKASTALRIKAKKMDKPIKNNP